MRDDVHRLDRLITDIAEASRLDAQLSRAKFEPVDLGRDDRRADRRSATSARRRARRAASRFDQPRAGRRVVLGEGARLERVFENLIDNAVSFSPDGGLVAIARRAIERRRSVVRVEDEGPGVPEEAREAIFRRFQSMRPEGEAFGQHSGLGLAIARTIVEGHQGTIVVEIARRPAERRALRRPLAARASR